MIQSVACNILLLQYAVQSNIYDGAFFAKIVKGFYPLSIFAKMPNHRYLTGF